jgi:hypothetical protein
MPALLHDLGRNIVSMSLKGETKTFTSINIGFQPPGKVIFTLSNFGLSHSGGT